MRPYLPFFLMLIYIYPVAFFSSRLCYTSQFGPDDRIPEFPSSFVFGVSTSAFEIQNGVPNSPWYLAGRVESANDAGEAFRGASRLAKDAALAKAMGYTVYRLSLPWPELNPHPDEFNQTAMTHYREWLLELNRLGLKPLLTLWHFEQPAWLEECGGVASADFVPAFAKFVEFVVFSTSDLCELYDTVNEPVAFAFASTLGGDRPSRNRSFSGFLDVTANLFKAHVAAYDIIKQHNPRAVVSLAATVEPIVPAHPWDLVEAIFCWKNEWYNSIVFEVFRTETVEVWGQTRYVPGIAGKLDVISINHYSVIFANPWGRLWQWLWDIWKGRWDGRWKWLWQWSWDEWWMAFATYAERADPGRTNRYEVTLSASSLGNTVRWVPRVYNPENREIFVSEHGCADWTGERREKFVSESLLHVMERLEGIPLVGCLWRSRVDNYTLVGGSAGRFGLSGANFTGARRATDAPEACNED
jgi:beta-glucosidase